MSKICISINAARFGGFEDLHYYQGNPLVAPIGYLCLANPAMGNTFMGNNDQMQYQQPNGGFMGNSIQPLFMNNTGAFIFDPVSPDVAYGTLEKLREIIRKNYPEDADVQFVSGGSTGRMSPIHMGYNEIRDLTFTESVNLQVRFRKANGEWYVHNRDADGWFRPVIKMDLDRDFVPTISKAVVLDSTSDQIQLEFDEQGNMVNARFLKDDDGNLTAFVVSDINKIFEYLYPGEGPLL